MTKTLVRCLFAALLAFLTTQPVATSPRVSQSVSIVWSAQSEQQAPHELHRAPAPGFAAPADSTYVSRLRPAPESAVLFQRPPPQPLLFA